MNEPAAQAKASSGALSGALARYVEPALLILLGGAGVVDGWRIIATEADTPGGTEAGGWIAALGALLVLGGCVHIVRTVLHGSDAEPAEGADALFGPPALALILLLLYVALITSLGYVLATALFMAAYLRIFGRYGLLTVAAIAVLFAAGSGWLWSALNLTLPRGVLPWP